MSIQLRKLDLKSFGIIIILLVFSFQRALLEISNIFSYIDEVLAIYVVFIIVAKSLKGERLQRLDFSLMMLMVLICVEGVISNIFSGVFTNWTGILVDIVSIFKVFLAYIWAKNLNCDVDRVIPVLAGVVRVIVFVMFICMLVSQFRNIGMSDSVRYGITSYKFVFDNAGNYSKFFYFVIPVLTADLKYKSTLVKKIFICMACICWVLTLRSRAFSFVALFIVLVIVYFRNKQERTGLKIKWLYLLIVLLIALIISWDQLIFYFTTETQARAVLLRYSFVTLADYFPLGAGFGTYGSDVAATYYSQLYYDYGFNKIYGMGNIHKGYLNDNYWPMILGQFGVIGTILVVIVLWMIYKEILQKLRSDKFFYFAAVNALLFLLISSVASKSYSEFSSICVFLLLGMMLPKQVK